MKKQLLTIIALCTLTVTTMAQVPSYVPSNGLVGWWPFNGNANDESGNGNNGTVSGATLTLDRDGNSNTAYAFDGASNVINVPHSTDFNTSEFSISVWALKDGQTIYNPGVVSKCESNNLGWYIITNSNQSDQLSFNGAVATSDYFGANSNVNMLNNWVHIVSVFSQGSQKLYVNGALADEDQNAGALYVYTGPMSIGYKNGDNYWGGKIDDIGIWNVALTQEEVTELYEAVDGPCLVSSAISFAGLDANYSLSDGSATLVGSPAGGAFFGEGVSAGQFDPSAAGVGTHGIVYTYVDENGCVGSYGLCTTVDVNVGLVDFNVGPDGGVDVYPNPSTGQYTLELQNLEGLVSYIVYDSRGREVSIGSLIASGNRTQHNIDLNTKAKGIYTLQLQTAQGTLTHKLVKN